VQTPHFPLFLPSTHPYLLPPFYLILQLLSYSLISSTTAHNHRTHSLYSTCYIQPPQLKPVTMSSTDTPGQGQQLASDSNESGNHPSRSRNNVIIDAHTVFEGDRIIGNNALVVADAAVRKAMWMLRDAHRVRDNIIRHRIAFLRRREEARKDYDLVRQSIMDAFSNNPHDTTGGRTIAQWQSAKEYYGTLMSRASKAVEREFWWDMMFVAHFAARRPAQRVRCNLHAAERHLQKWEQEKFELQADKELERARKRKSYSEY
jgi:hypothetical protein